MSYQLLEMNDASLNILCPHCQHAVVDWSEEQYVQPCEHTLFIAMSLGFEFVADRFEARMTQSVDELHEHPQLDIFQILTETPFEDMTIIKSDLGMENMYRYTGFSH